MSSISKRQFLATAVLAGFDPVVLEFIDDLRRREEIAESRVRHHRTPARHFLIWLELRSSSLEAVDSTVTDRFLQHDCDCCDAVPESARLHLWRKRRTSPELMRFIRFLERTGESTFLAISTTTSVSLRRSSSGWATMAMLSKASRTIVADVPPSLSGSIFHGSAFAI